MILYNRINQKKEMISLKNITRVAIITSGGDCQGLNAAIRAVGKTLYEQLDNVEIYGMYDGYRGLIDCDYKFMEPKDFSGILTMGGTILGTSRQRFVPGKDIVDEDGNSLLPAMLRTYNRLNLDCLIIMGGNGTQKSAKLLSDFGMNVITLPKTIDNDIFGTDTTFGFQSAVDIATNVIDYIHTTATSHGRIFVVECMGRDAGWLTLYAGIGSGADSILIPEIPYDIGKLTDMIASRKKKGKGFTIIACAEGAVEKGERQLSEDEARKKKEAEKYSTVGYRLAADLERLTGQDARVVVPGHFQRGGPPCAYDRVLATQFGAEAAELIEKKQYGRMVAMQGGKITSIPLEEAASKTKFLPVDHEMIKVARDIGICFGD